MMPGLSETLEVQEKYAHLQEEQLDNLKDDLVSCIHGEEGQGGDDELMEIILILMIYDNYLSYHLKGEPPKIPLLWHYSF